MSGAKVKKTDTIKQLTTEYKMDPGDRHRPGVGTESNLGDEISTGDQLVCSGVGLCTSQPTVEDNCYSHETAQRLEEDMECEETSGTQKEENGVTPSHYFSNEVSLQREEFVRSGYHVLQPEDNGWSNDPAQRLEEDMEYKETSGTQKEEKDVTLSHYCSDEVSLQRLLDAGDAGRRRESVNPTIKRRLNCYMSDIEKRQQVNSIISKKDDEWKQDGITNMELDVILDVCNQKSPIKDNLKDICFMEEIKDLEPIDPGMYFIVQGNGAEKHLTALIVNEDKDGTDRRSYVYFDSLNREIKWSLNHSLTYLTEKPLQAEPKTCAFFCFHLLSKVCNGVVIDKYTQLDHLFHGPNFDDEVLETFRKVYIKLLQDYI